MRNNYFQYKFHSITNARICNEIANAVHEAGEALRDPASFRKHATLYVGRAQHIAILSLSSDSPHYDVEGKRFMGIAMVVVQEESHLQVARKYVLTPNDPL